MHLGANLRIYAADLHEWLDAQGAQDSNQDSWNGVGETHAGEERERPNAKEGPLRRPGDLPQDFRTKSCLRDGLLGRGSHAQGAVYG